MARPALRFLAFTLLLGSWMAACGPSDPLERARQLQEKGELAASLELLQGLVDERPDDPEVHFRYGVALIGTNQASLAKWPLMRAMESPEWLERAGLTMAQSLLTEQRTDESIRVSNRVLEAHPDNLDALVLRAAARVRTRRDYEGALADAERVLEVDPDNLAALVPKTAALLGLERIEEAAEALEALENAHRDDTLGLHGSPALCAARATFMWENGDPVQAEERFTVCSEEFPGDPLILSERIKFYDRTKRQDLGEQLLRDALAAQPHVPQLRTALIDRLNAQGRDEEVEALLRETTEQAPELASSAWFSLALHHLERGEVEEASKSFERALSLDPSRSPEFLFGYADGLVVAGRLEEALRVAENMRVPAHKLLVKGRVALSREEPSEALRLFSRANQIWPDNAVARYYTAVAAEQVGDFRRAIEDYRYSMRIDPRATDAYLRLARLQYAAGRVSAAIRTLGFQAGSRPSEPEATVFALELLSLANLEPKEAMMARSPGPAEAAAALARGLRTRKGPEAAAEFLLGAEGLDLRDPDNAPALRVLIDAEAESAKAREALGRVEAALAAAPDSAALHALHGRALAASGAEAGAVRKAYQRALELDPEQALALSGLAEVDASEGQVESALGLYERAVAADSNDRDSARAAAALLVRLDRSGDAESRLNRLLREHPYDAAAAVALAELRLARGAEDNATRELARRALGFGGGDEAKALARRLGVGRSSLEGADLDADPQAEAPAEAEPESEAEAG